MATKKAAAKKKRERDIMDVFKDATKKRSALGSFLLNELQREHVNAERIYSKLQEMDYKAVRRQDVAWLLRNYKNFGELQSVVMDKGY